MADTAKTETQAAAPAITKPERPNEDEYKEKLSKADKELKAAEERMVGSQFPFSASERTCAYCCHLAACDRIFGNGKLRLDAAASESDDLNRSRSRPRSTMPALRTRTRLPPSASKSFVVS